MERNEAAAIIRAMSESLQRQPNQFQMELKVTATGQSFANTGGIGLQVSATGGGAGSTTIGNQVSANTGDLHFGISQQAPKALEGEMELLVQKLNSIAEQLEAQDPDRNLLSRIFRSFNDTWVPPVISAVIGAVLGPLIS